MTEPLKGLVAEPLKHHLIDSPKTTEVLRNAAPGSLHYILPWSPVCVFCLFEEIRSGSDVQQPEQTQTCKDNCRWLCRAP